MTSAPFDPHHRPDPARFARTTVGMAAPLWFPFLMAASAGAAWWTYASWGRLGARPRAGEGEGDPEPAPMPVSPPAAASSALAESLGVQGSAAPDTSAEEDASDLIDAAYAANLGPVPPPPEPPARKRAASKQPAAGKTATKKTPAKQTTATNAPAKAAAKKTAAKKTAAKAPAKKRGG